MSKLRIDSLRELVAEVGKKQLAYWEFFPNFALRLEKEFGDYLGDASSVALAPATDDFNFDQGSYRHAGLNFEDGKFRIPLMVRLKNLNDAGDLIVRIRIYFTMETNMITAEIKGEPVVVLPSLANDVRPLLDYAYQYLKKSFVHSAWFAENRSDYQGTRIGF